MSAFTVAAFSIAVLFITARAHSMMSEPQSTSPNVCRLGGDPNPGTCPGPCDMKAVEGRFANFDGPSHPAAKYRRGQRIKVKYQRNNHGPGGFVRHTLVPINLMMNKAAHRRNAFHYSCFGARPVRATASDRKLDDFGFSIAGTDGKRSAPGFYMSTITIPDVVPDGDYVFGWVWYGGTGGNVSNDWPYKREPWWKGYFGDYWSCSFVKVEGGNPMRASYTPVFENDMKMFSDEGCMSANDAPGVCTKEPCIVRGSYQKPRPFKNDNLPDPLTPQHFGGSSVFGREGTIDPPVAQPPPREGDSSSKSTDQRDASRDEDSSTASRDGEGTGREGDSSSTSRDREHTGVRHRRPDRNYSSILQRRSCRCIGLGVRCGKRIARRTGGRCKSRIDATDQPKECIRNCCEMCKVDSVQTRKFCMTRGVRQACLL